MKNKDFFYLQYNKIDWKNQEKTGINSFINDYIIQNVILKLNGDSISIFDIGFGVGYFIKMLIPHIKNKYKNIIIEGCEPSKVNYSYFEKDLLRHTPPNVSLNGFAEPFQTVKTNTKFDIVTAIYVFPHFLSDDLEEVVQKIHSLLNEKGKFVLALADEKYLQNKLATEKDLFIEKHTINYKGKEYTEILHYSDIPEIGKIIDYNRDEAYYLSLFQNNGFILDKKETLNDNGFICTLFIFDK